MQPSFFDHQDRLELLEQQGDLLPKLERTVDWAAFRTLLGSIYKNSGPSKGGRPPYDAVLMFNLSDDQTKLQIRARYSFYCFPGLSPEGKVPDAKTVWVYRERLKEPGLVDKLFSELLIQIDAAGFSVRKGQIVDAAIVPAPRQHNTREENRQIKAGDSTEYGVITNAARRMLKPTGTMKSFASTPSHQQKSTIARSSRNGWMRTIMAVSGSILLAAVEREAALPGCALPQSDSSQVDM
ncbi:transposase [Candidatus Vondammii sp. HM_W22]|uniref:transposase n=1 Tax=Candidatus Vondammii sp. HM_W22 TaxID=2687299 RepID=UPI001F12E8B2|nr:transposase [Candidatus Vondammii sp. HM_W22]